MKQATTGQVGMNQKILLNGGAYSNERITHTWGRRLLYFKCE